MRRAVAIAYLTMLAGPVLAGEPEVNWRAAGGGLFAQATTMRGDEPPPEPEALPGAVPRVEAPQQPFEAEIAAAAARHGLDPKLLHALVVVESAYRADARSPVGAYGLAQLMPGTARELGVRDPADPAKNVLGGADYLARQILRFGDVRLALAAYNAGPERVARLGRVPRIPETEAYVRSVVDCYLALTAGRAIRSSRSCRP
jgi:soluble lytic murein transglycosylase-like protein